MKSLVVRWDWKEAPPWPQITVFIEDFKSPAFFTGVTTGTDEYAVVITEGVVTYAVALEIYKGNYNKVLNWKADDFIDPFKV